VNSFEDGLDIGIERAEVGVDSSQRFTRFIVEGVFVVADILSVYLATYFLTDVCIGRRAGIQCLLIVKLKSLDVEQRLSADSF